MHRLKNALSLVGLMVALALAGCTTLPAAVSGDVEDVMNKGVVKTLRATPLRYAPSPGAPVIQSVPAATELDWLGNQTRDGFYRVGGRKGPAGWVRAVDVTVVQPHVLLDIHAESACATSLDQCAVTGCAVDGTADGLSNTLKHHVPAEAALFLSFDDLATLQQQADESVGSGLHIAVDARAALANMAVSGGKVTEGNAVRVIGFLASDGTGPHPNSSGESVNCGIKGAASNDFHLPVTADANSSEFDAIVVEMIPQGRPTAWTISRLKTVQTKQQQVWIEGNLFYDGQHRVNADPNNPIGGQPKRFSLWEIHPVTKFLVCEQTACSANTESEWRAL